MKSSEGYLKKKINEFSENKRVLYLTFFGILIFMVTLIIICLFFTTKEINMSDLDEDFTISDSGRYIITGSSNERVVNVVSGNPTITLKNLYIGVDGKDNLGAFKIGNSTSVKIILEGENILKSGQFCAGLQTQETSFLEISKESTGSLTAEGGKYGAGIGSGASTESLNTYAPGIGTGQYFGIISLYGGEIKAIAGEKNYAIGGDQSENDKIIINGAKVDADTMSHTPVTF